MLKFPVSIDGLLVAQLNPSQYEAVTSVEGPLLVVAGAGTGKTRVIEYRVLHMVSSGIRPESILLLTFTRRAAREMLARASRHNRLCEHVSGGTFHSFGYSIVSKYADILGFKRPLSFLDESDSEELLSRLASKMGLMEKGRRLPSKSTLRELISASFNRGETIERILLKEYPHLLSWADEIERLKESYVRYKIEHNLLDYDDLLLYLHVLLESEGVREGLSKRYRYVMVDEYQDTNHIQAKIVYLLGEKHRNVMVVGDDAQSIYAFRGARFENMFEFLQVFRDAKVVRLEDNYRSTQPILDLANSIIEGAKKKYTKVLRAINGGGRKPCLLVFQDPESEAEWIASKIKELWDEGVELSKTAVLFRSMYLVRPLEVSLSKRGIPYQTYGGLRFTETAHIKDVLAHIRVIVNGADELAWHRVLRLVEGVGLQTAGLLVEAILERVDWRGVLSDYAGRPRVKAGIERLKQALEAASRVKDVYEAVSIIVDYYLPILERKYEDYPKRLYDLESLKHISMAYGSAESFLLDLVAMEAPQMVVEDRQDIRLDTRPLVLSTIHSAKGLEWDTVFVLGLADGHLPLSYTTSSEEDVEEERRLLYVAVTRAKKELYLTMSHGGMRTLQRPSRFLCTPEVQRYLELEGARGTLPIGPKDVPKGEELARRILHGIGRGD